jgi:hypothetical protein
MGGSIEHAKIFLDLGTTEVDSVLNSLIMVLRDLLMITCVLPEETICAKERELARNRRRYQSFHRPQRKP